MQLIGRYDIGQDRPWRLSLALPYGEADTECGGLDTPVAGKRFSNGPALFTRLAYYL